jgi:predicted dehydrogenase
VTRRTAFGWRITAFRLGAPADGTIREAPGGSVDYHGGMAGRPVRFAILGCGSAAEAYARHLHRAAERGEAELAWLCDRREDKRDRVTARLGCPNYTADYAALLRRPDVDAVIVLTPMSLHAAHAVEALRAGKHVLVEKPMATRLSEARALAALARRSPGLLLCAPFTLLSATYRRVWHLVRRGAIGTIHSAYGLYGWAGPDWADWFYRRDGGALFDLGIYNLQALCGLLGSVRRVIAAGGTAVPVRIVAGRAVRVEAEDIVHATLDFGGNRFATIVCGFTIQRSNRPALELYGTEGTINVLGETWGPDGFEQWSNRRQSWERFPEAEPHWPWTAGVDHLVACVQRRTRPAVTPEQGVHLLEVMLAARRSLAQGRAVPIRSRFPAPVLPAPPDVALHRVHDPGREGL